MKTNTQTTYEEQAQLWEEIYAQGKMPLAPWSHVVSFLFHHVPAKPRQEVRILEVGCGSGANLFFAAQMGFSVTGLDFSPSAIEFIKKRFASANLQGDFYVADARELPLSSNRFDIVLDRQALTTLPDADVALAVEEVWRVLLPGGKFFFNVCSSRSSGAAAGHNADMRVLGGYRDHMLEGPIVGAGSVNFFSDSDIQRVLSPGKFCITQLQHTEAVDMKSPLREMHADWRVIAEKRNIVS